jgi:hypothetical protein
MVYPELKSWCHSIFSRARPMDMKNLRFEGIDDGRIVRS